MTPMMWNYFQRWPIPKLTKSLLGTIFDKSRNHRSILYLPFLSKKVSLCAFGIMPYCWYSSCLRSARTRFKKSPIGQKLDFANHPYLCKGLNIQIRWKKLH
jgi:hypothetical protein